MIKIELTIEQTNALMQLIDIAIKAGGYQNAKVTLKSIVKNKELLF